MALSRAWDVASDYFNLSPVKAFLDIRRVRQINVEIVEYTRNLNLNKF